MRFADGDFLSDRSIRQKESVRDIVRPHPLEIHPMPDPLDVESGLETLGLPPIDQIGFVVRSLAESEKRYSALFGPWRFMDGTVEAATYRGRICDAKLDLMFGRSGDLEIEFIEWKRGDCPHREFIEAGREGMHHLRYRVDDADAWIEKFSVIGYRPIWYKQYSAEIVFAYLEREGDPLLVELLQMP